MCTHVGAKNVVINVILMLFLVILKRCYFLSKMHPTLHPYHPRQRAQSPLVEHHVDSAALWRHVEVLAAHRTVGVTRLHAPLPRALHAPPVANSKQSSKIIVNKNVSNLL